MSADMVALQIRHGAALALREVLRHQADAAGVLAPVAAHPTGWSHCSRTASSAALPVTCTAALYQKTMVAVCSFQVNAVQPCDTCNLVRVPATAKHKIAYAVFMYMPM